MFAPTPSFWRSQAIGWTLLAGFGFCIRLLVFRDLAVALICTAVVDTLGFLLTSAMARQPFTRVRTGEALRSISLATVWCVGIAMLLAFVAYRLRVEINPTEEPAIRGNEYVVGFIYHVSIITAWTLAFLGIRAEMESRSQRMQALDAEARALRLEVESLNLQIEPHFLFNALNTIVSEIGDRPAIAEEMTRQLAAYLRYSLRKRDAFDSFIQEELEAVEMFVHIQTLRFDDRLLYHCTVDPCTLSARVPHMAIQCLVENAIKHGLRADTGILRIDVRVLNTSDGLLIEVENTDDADLQQRANEGIGLTNLQRRLELHYPERNHFSLTRRGGRTVATLKLMDRPC